MQVPPRAGEPAQQDETYELTEPLGRVVGTVENAMTNVAIALCDGAQAAPGGKKDDGDGEGEGDDEKEKKK